MADTIVQLEHSQCPLVEMDSTILVYLFVPSDEYAYFDIYINGDVLCSVGIDQQDTAIEGQAACSAATYATEGW